MSNELHVNFIENEEIKLFHIFEQVILSFIA